MFVEIHGTSKRPEWEIHRQNMGDHLVVARIRCAQGFSNTESNNPVCKWTFSTELCSSIQVVSPLDGAFNLEILRNCLFRARPVSWTKSVLQHWVMSQRRSAHTNLDMACASRSTSPTVFRAFVVHERVRLPHPLASDSPLMLLHRHFHCTSSTLMR